MMEIICIIFLLHQFTYSLNKSISFCLDPRETAFKQTVQEGCFVLILRILVDDIRICLSVKSVIFEN